MFRRYPEGEILPSGVLGVGGIPEGSGELLSDVGPNSGVFVALGVEFQAVVGKAHRVQFLLDLVEGRSLLGDEEDLLAVGKARGDEIGDRLCLAGSRRTLQPE